MSQSCDVTHVQSATQWAASVHTSHMSKAVILALFSGCLVAFWGVICYFLLLLVFLGSSLLVAILGCCYFLGCPSCFWGDHGYHLLLLCCFFPFWVCPCCFWGVTFCYFWGFALSNIISNLCFLSLNLFSILLTFTPRPSLHSILCEDDGQVIAHPVLLRCASLQSLKTSLGTSQAASH